MIGLDSRLANLVLTIRRYDAKLSEIEIYYNDMKAEVNESLSDSIGYWNSFAENEQASSSVKAGITIENINGLIDKMQEIITKLCEIDSFFRFYYSKHKNESSLLDIDLNSNQDYYSITYDLYGNLYRIANECSRSVKAFPIQGLEMVISPKRKNNYARILSIYSQANQIADIACIDLPRKTTTYWSQLAEQRDTEIAIAEQECTELTKKIESEHEGKKSELLLSFIDSITSLFSQDYQERINDYLSSEDYPNVHEDFSPILPVGYFSSYIDRIVNPEVEEIVMSFLDKIIENRNIILPAIYDGKKAQNFAIQYDLNAKDAAATLSLSLILSKLSNCPAGYQRFVFTDPEERTSTFKPFLDFISSCPELFGNRILTTSEQIATSLKTLSAYIDESAQKQFAGFEDIYEYNECIIDKQAPYQTLVLIDFPKYFNESMLDDLWNIVNTGSPYGVGVIIQMNKQFINNKANERYKELFEKILSKVVLIQMIDNQWSTIEGVSFVPFDINIDMISDFENRYIDSYSKKKKSGILLNKVIDLSQIGTGCSKDFLSIPFAIDETGCIKCFEVGDPIASGISHYALITGDTGSGKSTLLHTIVMSAIIKYPPDELLIYLMDFKEGTEFKIYAEKQIPHIKLLAMDTMQEFGLSILTELIEEKERRAQLFKNVMAKTGVDVKNISQYRNVTGEVLPRILVILDEFQVLYDGSKNRKVAMNCAAITSSLLATARVYGINIIFATQLLSRLNTENYTVQKSSFNSVHVRIGLKGSEAEADLLFGGEKGKIAFQKYSEEKGTGAYVEDDTTGTPVGIRCAYCPDTLQAELLKDIREQYTDREFNMRIFSGDYVPNIAKTEELHKATDSDQILLLGEPIMIAPNLKIDLRSKRRNNLLITGTDTNMMNQLVKLISFSIQHFFSDSSILYYIDGEILSGGTINQELIPYLQQNNIVVAKEETDIFEIIEKCYISFNELRCAKQSPNINKTLIYINNIQWIELVKSIIERKRITSYNTSKMQDDIDISIEHLEDPFSPLSSVIVKDDKHVNGTVIPNKKKENPNVSEMFYDLLENGYLYGYHIIISSVEYQAIKEAFYEIGPLFTHRIVFGLNDRDADKLIPDVSVQGLPKNILVYSNGLNVTCQFKPFEIN